jgi:cytochrome c-type biogenesis protein CcmF
MNYSSAMATVEAAHGKDIAVMHPERRHYPVAGQTTSEVAIRTTLHDDLYVVLGDRDTDDKGWIVRVWVHPLIPFLWLGYAMVAFGGFLGVWGRLWRKK